MKIVFIAGLLVTAAIVPMQHANGEVCNVSMQIKAAENTTFLNSLHAALKGAPKSGVSCGALTTVFQKVVSRGKVGGRKLENDKPLNEREAAAELTEATSDQAIGSRIKAVQAGAGDPLEALLLQAAILDDEGLYAARDLILSRFSQVASGAR